MAKKNGSKLTRSQLSEAAKEVQSQLGLTEDDGVTPALDPKAKKDDLQAKLIEAGALADPQEDELSEKTWGVLEKIGAAHRPAQEYIPDRSDEQAEEIIEDNSEHTRIPDSDDQEPTDDRDMGEAKKDLDRHRGVRGDESLSEQESASETTKEQGIQQEQSENSDFNNPTAPTENTTNGPDSSKVGQLSKGKKRRAFMESLIVQAKYTKKEIVDKTLEQFPDDIAKSTLTTEITDGKNPKYNKFSALLHVDENKVVSFKE